MGWTPYPPTGVPLIFGNAFPGGSGYPIQNPDDPNQVNLYFSLRADLGLASPTEVSDSLVAVAQNAILATGAFAEAGDLLSASGSNLTHAVASRTEAGDALTSTATNASHATAALTESADTLASASTSGNTANASLAIAEASDSLAAAATNAIAATLAIAEASDSLAGAATNAIAATLAAAESADVLVSAATNMSHGASSVAENIDTLSAASTSGATGLNAALLATESSDTLVGAATAMCQAAGTFTELGDTLSGAATAAIQAALALAEDAAGGDVLGADSTSVSLIANADCNVTEAPDTLYAVQPSLDLGGGWSYPRHRRMTRAEYRALLWREGTFLKILGDSAPRTVVAITAALQAIPEPIGATKSALSELLEIQLVLEHDKDIYTSEGINQTYTPQGINREKQAAAVDTTSPAAELTHRHRVKVFNLERERKLREVRRRGAEAADVRHKAAVESFRATYDAELALMRERVQLARKLRRQRDEDAMIQAVAEYYYQDQPKPANKANEEQLLEGMAHVLYRWAA